jgi:raffinose/stachyose/melibiose transport system permease protein
MDKLLGNKKIILLFVLPAMLVYLVFYLAPIIATTGLSFTQWDLVQSPIFAGLTNYAALFKDSVFKTGLKNIAILVSMVLLVQLPVSLMLALMLAKLTKGVRFIKTSFFIPVVFSATAVGLVWLRMFDSTYGVINDLFRLFGLDYQQMWLSNPKQAIWAITFPMIWCKTGYYLILFYAAIKAIPLDYYQAALIDGCTGVRATFKITIPLLRNNICMCAVLCAIGAIKEYPLIYVMTLGGPFKSTYTPAMEMYTKAFLEFDFGYGCTLAVVLVAFSLFVYKMIHWLIPTQDIQY